MYGLKHRQEKRSMDYFAGLEVSVKETSVCIVDDTGKIVREVKVASEPEALLAVLKNPASVDHSRETGSIATACLARSSSPLSPTTHSRSNGDFLGLGN